MNFKQPVSFLFSLFFLPAIIFSQNNNFKKWSVKDGLPQSVIYSIKQDKRGYIWIGTGGGACQFDGKNFKTVSKKEGLSGNAVRSILEDSRGWLWFGTDEGITVYNGNKLKTINKLQGFSGSTVLCFLEDSNKNIWVGTDDGGINKITCSKKDSFEIKVFGDTYGLNNYPIFDLYEDKDRHIWAATFRGINVLKPLGDGYEVKSIRGKNIPSDKLLCIADDKEGDLWFGTYDAGAFKINLSAINNDNPLVDVYNTSNGLIGNSVWDIVVTKNKNIWMGTTENGISRLVPINGKSAYKIESYTSNQGLSGNQVLSLFEDSEENMWIGTNGDGLCMLTGDYFAHYNLKDGLPNNKITSIKQDINGNYWLASYGGGLSALNFINGMPLIKTYTEKDGLSSNFLTTVSIGNFRNPNIWIGTSNQGIIKFDGHRFIPYQEVDGLADNKINYLFVDTNGVIWCGTSGGISRYNGIKFLNSSTEKMIMHDDGVKTIIEDEKGNIWYGTAGGLARYARNGILKTFDEVEGLKQKDVNSIVEGTNGNIWIGTNTGGLYKFNVHKPDTAAIEFVANDSLLASNSIHALVFQDDKTLIVVTNKGFDKLTLDASEKIIKVKNYDATDGFIGVECNDNAAYKDSKGDIWFGTVNGLTRYSPALEKKSAAPPQTHISGLQLFYKNIDWSAKADSITPWFNLPASLTLPYYENNLTFYFSAISLSNPEKIKFRYMLEGRENEWSPARADDHANFSGLSDGMYTFKVKACDANGNWSAPSEFTFTITPPWYKTIWFYLSCMAIILLSVYSYIKFREKKLIEEKKILEEIVTERTEEVVKQKEQLSEKNREITDSITYAKGIQEAILPAGDIIKELLPESFILFKPKDIVSGDFYWVEKAAEKILFAAVDCTGHGVPGGFVSMVGANGLNRSVKEYGITEPAKILDRLSALVEETFSKRKDGMDISLCAVNKKEKKMEFAGANNPLYVVRENIKPLIVNGIAVAPNIIERDNMVLYEIKADKQPIGSFEGRKNFTNHVIEVEPNDAVYVSSDGYADQFGGPLGKKLNNKKLKQLLISMYQKPMEQQLQILDTHFKEWKGNLEQIDDICIIGVRV